MDFANATRQYKLKLGFSLSGTREKNLLRLTSGLDGVMKLASRRNFKPASPREKMPEHDAVRIGFHRETDSNPSGRASRSASIFASITSLSYTKQGVPYFSANEVTSVPPI